MRIGRAIGVGFDATDRFVRPLPRTKAFTTVRGRRHAPSLSDPYSINNTELLWDCVLWVAWAHHDYMRRVDRYRLAGPGLDQLGEGPGAAPGCILELLDDPVEREVYLELVAGDQKKVGRRH